MRKQWAGGSVSNRTAPNSESLREHGAFGVIGYLGPAAELGMHYRTGSPLRECDQERQALARRNPFLVIACQSDPIIGC
jgi:hypothetical protein